jgi:hypothetical protein
MAIGAIMPPMPPMGFIMDMGFIIESINAWAVPTLNRLAVNKASDGFFMTGSG